MTALQLLDVHKRYGGVRALNGASLTAERGEVHGLLGPNGSGKSTLNKVLTGVVAADRATVTIGGSPARIDSPQDAARHDIAAVYQNLTLVPELTVEQNIVLGIERHRLGFLRRSETRAAARTVLERLGPALGGDVAPTTRVGTLTPGRQQLIELGKALVRRPRILVLDEATASLHKAQVAEVFDIVRELREDGVSIIFVSHRLDEIYEICDRATVVRSGESVATVETDATSERELVHLMVGEEGTTASGTDPRARTDGGDRADDGTAPAVLEVRNLHGPRLHGIDLTVRAGEIVGLGGLQGQGQSELLLTVFGALPVTGGEVRLAGTPMRFRTPRQATAAGVALVPGDRSSQGLLAVRPIQENLSVVSLARRALARIFVVASRERAAAMDVVESLQIKIDRLTDPVSSLSGGNQQKVILGKWLLATPRLILLDDPTKGVDVGAKSEIYELIRDLAASGVAVIFNSSEDRELAELAHRAVVLYEGRLTDELSGDRLGVDSLVSSALQVTDPPVAVTEREELQ